MAVVLACLPISAGPVAHAQSKPAATTRPRVSDLPRKGLVALWSAEGDAKDSVGTNHGKLMNGTTFAPGKCGRAFKLDGLDDHVEFANRKALQIVGDQTISMWIKPDRLDKKRFLMSKSWNELRIFVTTGGVLNYAYGRDGTPRWEHVMLSTIPAAEHAITRPPWIKLKTRGRRATVRVGEWTHIAATRDMKARTLRWYVNGQRVCQGPAPIVPTISTRPLWIAKSRHGHPSFAGLVDEVAIWSRALRDGEIWRVYSAHELLGALGVRTPIAARETLSDRVVVDGGDVLKGEIEKASYRLATSFGKVVLPARRVAGIVPVAGGKGRVWMLLTDGQAVLGTLATNGVRLKVNADSTLRIPLSEVKQVGYRISKDKPASRAEAILTLRSGQRLAWTSVGGKLQLRTPYGTVDLPTGALAVIELDPGKGLHRARLSGGSSLCGQLLPERPTVSLQLGPRVTVPRKQLVRLAKRVKPLDPPEAAVAVMRNGDRLVGRVGDEAFTIEAASGPVSIRPQSVRTIKFRPPKDGDVPVTVRAWDGTALSGPITQRSVAFSLVAGGSPLKLSTAQIASITREVALPPPKVVEKLRALVAQLGDDSYRRRDAATEELIGMGSSIAPVLRKHLASRDLEVRERIRMILENLTRQLR